MRTPDAKTMMSTADIKAALRRELSASEEAKKDKNQRRAEALRKLPFNENKIVRLGGLVILGLAFMGAVAAALLLKLSIASPIVIPFVLLGAVGFFMTVLPRLSIRVMNTIEFYMDKILDRRPVGATLELPPRIDTGYKRGKKDQQAAQPLLDRVDSGRRLSSYGTPYSYSYSSDT